MKTRFIAVLAATMLAVVSGCAATSDDNSDSAEGAASTGTVTANPEVVGGLKVVLDGHTVSYDYKLSKIDMVAKTVLWNAHMTDRGGHPTAGDDVDVHGAITAVARCGPGCFTAEVPGGRKGPLAVIDVSSFKAVSIKYEGVDAKLISASPVGTTTTTGSPSDTGACTLNKGKCKPTKRSDCKVGPLFPAERGAMVFVFDAGGTCGP